MEIMNEVLAASGAVLANIAVASILGFGLYRLGVFRDFGQLTETAARRGRALAILAGLNFVVSGTGKLLGFDPMVEKFTLFGLMHWFTLTGVLEISVGLTILFPQSYKLGFLLGTATAGGAIATHLPEHSDGIIWAIPSSTFLAILWLSGVLYKPELFPGFISNLFHGKHSG